MTSQLFENWDFDPRALDDAGAWSGDRERRRAPRTDIPFPVTIRGITSHGDPFVMTAALDNFSAGGLYVRMQQPVELGSKLFVLVRLSFGAPHDAAGPRLAIRGRVSRMESLMDGRCGVAVAAQCHRFLYAACSD